MQEKTAQDRTRQHHTRQDEQQNISSYEVAYQRLYFAAIVHSLIKHNKRVPRIINIKHKTYAANNILIHFRKDNINNLIPSHKLTSMTRSSHTEQFQQAGIRQYLTSGGGYHGLRSSDQTESDLGSRAGEESGHQ